MNKSSFIFYLRILLITFFWLWDISLGAQNMTPFEQNGHTSADYDQIIKYYQTLADQHKAVHMEIIGTTDVGKPLHSVTISKDGDFEPASIHAKGKLIFLINNGIHAGEPCGIDASMMLVRDLVENNSPLLDSVVLVVIPVYNIGGVLNRNRFSRANQNGPEAYGFRGNAKNLDLNRDFIKCDSKNALSFTRMFTRLDPDVFLDNHTTNGADYPYVMTLISSQKDKATPPISSYVESQLLPSLFSQMESTPYLMSTYVNVRSTPDQGIAGFLDLPRYSSGYATLHNTISFISEAHMLKPFDQRVRGTYALMRSMLKSMHEQKAAIQQARTLAKNSFLRQDSFPIQWQLDFSQKDSLLFKGYTAKEKESNVTGKPRRYFDHDDPYEKHVPLYNHYKIVQRVEAPQYYILPQAYESVIRRLQLNGVRMNRLRQDTILEADFYYITDFKTSQNPYEGHYLHTQVKTETKRIKRSFYKGDFMIEVAQPAIRYIIETLEPEAPDSFFAWNFFDGILMQKEYFSSYVFEETAEELLRNDPSLKKALEEEKSKNPDLEDNARAQLDFIYKRSPHYESTHRLYPVGRIY